MCKKYYAKKHVQSTSTHFDFFVFFLVNQNIHAQICTHVKSHHHHMNYVILDHSIFLLKFVSCKYYL
jgi:hypothetical protein